MQLVSSLARYIIKAGHIGSARAIDKAARIGAAASLL
jgi:hypothetical protein